MPTSEYGKDTFRALLIPDERVNESNIDTASSTFTQADPQPGVPVPQGPTDLNLESSGTQSASKQLRITTQKGGHPGRGSATYRWKNEADAGTLWRGAWPPNAMSGWKTAKAVNPSATNGARVTAYPHSVYMDNGKLGVCCYRTYYTLGTLYHQVRFFSIEKDGTISSGVTVFQSLTKDHEGMHPCLVSLPSGRLMLYHYFETDSDTVQIRSWMSDDYGTNWTLCSDAALDTAIDVSAGTSGYDLDTNPSAKMRVAYSGGQMLMLISARSNDTGTGSYQDALIQYASTDLGQTFEHIETWDRTATATQGEVVPSSNGFEVFYVGGTAGSDAVIRKSLSSAYIPIQSAGQITGPGVLQAGNWAPGGIASRLNTDAEIATAIGDDGILYIIARGRHSAGAYASSNLSDIRMCMDITGGSTRTGFYSLLGQGTSGAASSAPNGGTVFFGEGGADYPKRLALAPAWGKLHLFHNHSASTATRDNNLSWMQLGGYSNFTLGGYKEDGSLERRVCWDYTWLPIEEPDNFANWTASTTATFAATVNSGYLNLSTTSGKVLYNKTPPGTVAEGIIAYFGVQFVSMAAPPTNEFILTQITQADGSDKHTINVIIQNGTVKVKDNNGGAVLGTLSIDTTTNGVEVLVFFKAAKATVYARLMTRAADVTWSAVCSNAAVSDSGTGTCDVKFGHSAASTAESNWFFYHWTSDEYAGGTPYSSGFTNPDDLLGAPFNTIGSSYIDDGVSIRGVDGPTVPGDSWNIDTRYGYGIENVMIPSEPSPSKGWRSTNESAQDIVWTFEGPNSYRGLGLYLDGCNWKEGDLYGWNELTSAWVKLCDINMAEGQTGLAYNRVKNGVTVNTAAGTTAGRYYQLSELIGGTLDLGSSKFRTITGNTPGIWTNAAGHQLPGVKFSGLDNSEPASGTLDIWSPRIFIAVHNITPVYTKFKLTIVAQQTATDDLRIGQIALGKLQLFSQDYSWGRVLTSEGNTDLTTYRDGSRSSINRGPNRRSVSFGWGEGVDTTSLQGSAGLDPEYLLGSNTSGAPVIGYRGDIPSIMTQTLSLTAGSHLPVVYAPNIAKGTGGSGGGSDVITIQGLGPVYGRIISAVSQDAIVGDEGSTSSGELMRISNIAIEEEL